MERHLRNNYFLLIKIVGIVALIGRSVILFRNHVSKAGLAAFVGALFLLFAVAREQYLDNRKKVIWLLGELATAVAGTILIPELGVYLLAIMFLDLAGEYQTVYYLGSYVILIVAYKMEVNIGFVFVVVTLLMVIYYQHYKVIHWYRKTSQENALAESRLKSDIEHSNLVHKDEMKQSRLRHENELLEEKGRISQALHDKLGHSINGSLYKLEAVKVLMQKDPQQSEKILQEVIDNLRGSMDEIRVIIRNERPDKKRMAMKSLQALCTECEEQYNIKTELQIEAEDKVIPENIWEIILDNTFEAVTNALKYSGCTQITITIQALGEVVRATIMDNGKGAKTIDEGMGISGMKTRVRKVKGYIDIESENGFRINMILPIGKKTEEKDGTN